LHAAAGAAIEALPARKRDGRAAELAWNFLRADDSARALAWSMLAADQAAAVFAHSDAELHYRTAIELAQETGDEARRAEALTKLGDSLTASSRYGEALDVLGQAAMLYRELGDRPGEIRALAATGIVHSYHGTAKEGLALIKATLSSLDSEEPSPELARLYLALTHLSFRAGRDTETLAASERTAAIAREIGDERILAQAEMRLGTVGRRFNLSGTEESMALLRQARTRAGAVGDLSTASVALNNLAYACLLDGRLQDNLEYRKLSLEVGERIDEPARHAFGLCMVGQAHYFLGSFNGGRALIERAIELVRGLPLSVCTAYPMLNAAWIASAQGRWDEATSYLAECSPLLRNQDAQAAGIVRFVGAELHLLRNRPQAALATYAGTQPDQLQPWEPPALC